MMTSEEQTRILLVEDDMGMRFLLTSYLEKEGFQVSTAEDAEEFMNLFEQEGADLVLMDLNLPDEDGMDLMRRLRSRSEVPVIMVTSRDRDMDRIAGLELGADDYITKPFHPRELMARVRNVIKRSAPARGGAAEGELQNDSLQRFHGFLLNHHMRTLNGPDGEDIPLTRGEFDLLTALAEARGRVLNRDQLIDAVSRRDDPPMDRTIDVLISRIRRKIEQNPKRPRYLLTKPGYGYLLTLENPETD